MPKFEISQRVEEGSLVSLRENKFIRASRTSKIVGAYTHGGSRRTLSLDGQMIDTVLPKGIVVAGAMFIRMNDDVSI